MLGQIGAQRRARDQAVAKVGKLLDRLLAVARSRRRVGAESILDLGAQFETLLMLSHKILYRYLFRIPDIVV